MSTHPSVQGHCVWMTTHSTSWISVLLRPYHGNVPLSPDKTCYPVMILAKVENSTLPSGLRGSDPIVFMSVVVNTSDHIYDDCLRLIFLHAHRETSALDGELSEESDRFRFFQSACLANRKDSVGLILDKTESFHTSPSLHSLSSRPLSSRSFPSPISSTFCRTLSLQNERTSCTGT